MTTEATETIEGTPPKSEPIVAKAGVYFRFTRYIMFIGLVAYGAASIRDGFFTWPNWAITHPDETPKSDWDIFFNRAMGVVLPPIGIFILVRALRQSRGEYRLEGGVVHAPGHPPIPLDAIQALDRELWDRKGIADVEYDLSKTPGPSPPTGNQHGKFRLDDFIYQREPIDQIFETIEAALKGESPAPAAPAAEDPTPAPAKATPKPVVSQPAPAKLAPTKPPVAKPPLAKPIVAAAKPPVGVPPRPAPVARPPAGKPPTPPPPRVG
jgi:hypothetical protein